MAQFERILTVVRNAAMPAAGTCESQGRHAELLEQVVWAEDEARRAANEAAVARAEAEKAKAEVADLRADLQAFQNSNSPEQTETQSDEQQEQNVPSTAGSRCNEGDDIPINGGNREAPVDAHLSSSNPHSPADNQMSSSGSRGDADGNLQLDGNREASITGVSPLADPILPAAKAKGPGSRGRHAELLEQVVWAEDEARRAANEAAVARAEAEKAKAEVADLRADLQAFQNSSEGTSAPIQYSRRRNTSSWRGLRDKVEEEDSFPNDDEDIDDEDNDEDVEGIGSDDHNVGGEGQGIELMDN
ncbi:uncharacterized protein LOC116023543 [Ipomoea triloba]|uniref:uncharacterized protein LOC116023543 n=1 Tax=Ipomoea triloba TaxID=35885 RepID=UPI00125CF375|nr:uncharacterized protein LOC116023543 [Ipomoea triloba]